MSKWTESAYPWILGSAIGIACGVFIPYSIKLETVLGGIVNVGAIAIGFLATALTALLAMKQEGRLAISKLEEKGHYKRLIRFLIDAIRLSFVLMVLCVVAVFIESNFDVTKLHRGWLYRKIGIGLCMAALAITGLACYRIIELFHLALTVEEKPQVNIPPKAEEDAQPGSNSASSS